MNALKKRPQGLTGIMGLRTLHTMGQSYPASNGGGVHICRIMKNRGLPVVKDRMAMKIGLTTRTKKLKSVGLMRVHHQNSGSSCVRKNLN